MARLITAQGVESEVRPGGQHFTLAELYSLLGCEVVQAVPLADGSLMWMDEEGKYANPPKRGNAVATRLLAAAGGAPGDTVVGPVVIEKGETD